MQLAISTETMDQDGAIPGGYYFIAHIYMPIAGVSTDKAFAQLIVSVGLS
jgi:hypothetical protein